VRAPSQQWCTAEASAAGGECEYHLFENSVHEWVAEPGPQTDKAREVVKQFIARQLKA
jgi:acetyl esterase